MEISQLQMDYFGSILAQGMIDMHPINLESVLNYGKGAFATFKLRDPDDESSFFDSVKSDNFLDEVLLYGFNIKN